MAAHSSVLAWRIPWTEELGGLSSRARKELDMTEWLTYTHTHTHTQMLRRQGQFDLSGMMGRNNK